MIFRDNIFQTRHADNFTTWSNATRHVKRCLTATFVYGLLATGLAVADDSQDWPRWRGPRDNGSAEIAEYPVRFDKSTLQWKAALPGKGCSTPIVLRGNVYLTAPVESNDAVLSFDWSGRQRWSTAFGPETAGKHITSSGCNASPVTDGSAVYVYFKSGLLAAVELDGTVRWKTNLSERFGKDDRFWDHGTSPVLTKKHVVMARMHSGDSWVAAFDKKSGELAWKVARNYKTALEADQCYTTPLVIQHQGREAILVWGAEHVTIHDAADGKAYWSCGGFNPDSYERCAAIATPVIVDDIVTLCFGSKNPRQSRLHGVRLTGSGDVTGSNRVWDRDDTGSFVPSPAVDQGRVYLVRDRGEVECIAPASGETIWSDALPKSRLNFYASPIIAGGNLYTTRRDGAVFVAKINDDGIQLLAENEMNEQVIASPVPVKGCILVRGEKHLFCFGPAAGQD